MQKKPLRGWAGGRAALGLILALGLPGLLSSQEVDWGRIQVQTREIRGGVHLLSNAGGNIAAFLGEDGVLLVDAGYEEMAQKVMDAARGLSEEGGTDPTIRIVVNTHWHYDHIQGNESMAHRGALVIGHERAVRLMAEDRVLAALERDVPAAPPEGRPILTFNDRMNLQWNGDLIHLVHMPLAHSDGDVIIHFRDANVVHLGDLFFNGTYPYIDADYGGNLQGMVRALREVTEHTLETTLFIPGHGPLATRADLTGYLQVLEAVLGRVQQMLEQGMSREEVIAAKPTAEFDADWAPEGSWISPDYWVGLVYDGMVRSAGGG